MTNLGDISEYFCKHYPHPSELSKARLTKLVYLADWESKKRTGSQLTNIKWYFHNFGPYVDDVIDEVKKDTRFKIDETLNFYGDKKTIIGLSDQTSRGSQLSSDVKHILDDVINATRGMYWNDFIKHVYATEPVVRAVRYSFLDLDSAYRNLSESVSNR